MLIDFDLIKESRAARAATEIKELVWAERFLWPVGLVS